MNVKCDLGNWNEVAIVHSFSHPACAQKRKKCGILREVRRDRIVSYSFTSFDRLVPSLVHHIARIKASAAVLGQRNLFEREILLLQRKMLSLALRKQAERASRLLPSISASSSVLVQGSQSSSQRWQSNESIPSEKSKDVNLTPLEDLASRLRPKRSAAPPRRPPTQRTSPSAGAGAPSSTRNTEGEPSSSSTSTPTVPSFGLRNSFVDTRRLSRNALRSPSRTGEGSAGAARPWKAPAPYQNLSWGAVSNLSHR
jgi:hypothetical protein